jgi:hypothetical protein
MTKALFLMGAVAAVCAGAASQIASTQSLAPVRPTTETPASTSAPTTANVAMPSLTPDEQQMLARRFSPDRLAAIRARLQADGQRAVRDEVEQAFREPTAGEAAALAGPPSEATAAEVTLTNGGAALKADASSVSFVRAAVANGDTVVTHDGKGARRDQ